MSEERILNKVDESGLIQFDLENLYRPGPRLLFDLAGFLHEGLILKEKDFRQRLRETDWEPFRNGFVAVTCTADAILPTWAFMLAAVYLEGMGAAVVFGDLQNLEEALFRERISVLDPEHFRDRRIIVKGCSDKVPASAYVDLIHRLQPVVKAIMFGEACSTVPLYKAKG